MTQAQTDRMITLFRENMKPWQAYAIAKILEMPKRTVNKILYENEGVLWSKCDERSWISKSSSKVHECSGHDHHDTTTECTASSPPENTCAVQNEKKIVELAEQDEPTENQVDDYFVVNDYAMTPRIVAQRLGYESSKHKKKVKFFCYKLGKKGMLKGIRGNGDTDNTFGEFITARLEETAVDDLQKLVKEYNATLSSQLKTTKHPPDWVTVTYSISLTLIVPNVKRQFEARTPRSCPSTRDAHTNACYEMLRQIQQNTDVSSEMNDYCRRLIAHGHARRAQHTFGQPYYTGAECHFVEYKGSPEQSEPMTIKTFRHAFNNHCGKFLSAVWNTLYRDKAINGRCPLIQKHPFSKICIVFGVHDSQVIQGIEFEGDSLDIAAAEMVKLRDDREQKLRNSFDARLKPENVVDALKNWVKMEFQEVESHYADGKKYLYIMEVFLPTDEVPPAIDTFCTWDGTRYYRDGAATKKVKEES